MCLRILFSRILSHGGALWSAAARLPLFRLLTPLRIFRSSISHRVAAVSAALCLLCGPASSQSPPFTYHLLERAQSGHVQEELEVARAFQLGLGVDRDLAEAARWFQKAADQGSPEAQCQLGFFYHAGSGVPRDDREAFKWYQRAALQDYAPAQFDLSLILLGSGTHGDLLQAAQWMMKAAQQGFPSAQTDIGIFYLRGYGVPADKKEGIRWLREAAKHHFAPAEFAIGTMYQDARRIGPREQHGDGSSLVPQGRAARLCACSKQSRCAALERCGCPRRYRRSSQMVPFGR